MHRQFSLGCHVDQQYSHQSALLGRLWGKATAPSGMIIDTLHFTPAAAIAGSVLQTAGASHRYGWLE